MPMGNEYGTVPNMSVKEPELSMVVPRYNEALHLEDVILTMTQAFQNAGLEYEICIVNNGSSDATAAVIEKLKAANPRITGITIAVNQGYGGGILSGLAAARGEVLGGAHADGQVDPNDIILLFHKKIGRASCRERG